MTTGKPKSEKPDSGARDQMLIAALSDDGKTAGVLRSRGGGLEAGLLQPAEEGKPLTGELVKLQRHEERPLLYDVETLAESPFPVRRDKSHAGPPLVASDGYRKGWEAIWGIDDDDGLLN